LLGKTFLSKREESISLRPLECEVFGKITGQGLFKSEMVQKIPALPWVD